MERPLGSDDRKGYRKKGVVVKPSLDQGLPRVVTRWPHAGAERTAL